MVVISETMRGCQLDAIRIEFKLAKHSQNSTKIEGRGANRRERGSGQALTLAKKKRRAAISTSLLLPCSVDLDKGVCRQENASRRPGLANTIKASVHIRFMWTAPFWAHDLKKRSTIHWL